MRGIRRVIAALLCLFLLAFSLEEIICPDTGLVISSAQAAKVKLNKKKASLKIGETLQLAVEGTTKTVKWSSSDKETATVSKKGLVRAKKEGTVTITAKVGKKTYECAVTVDPPEITLNKSKATLTVGKTVQLAVDGTEETVKWSSSDKEIATVSKKGLVRAKKAGKATITAKVNGKSLKCKITVNALLSSSENEVTLKKGASRKLVITYRGDKTVEWNLSWHIDNSSIAKVQWGEFSGNTIGLTITGKGVGSAVVTVKDEVTQTSLQIPVTVTGSSASAGVQPSK